MEIFPAFPLEDVVGNDFKCGNSENILWIKLKSTSISCGTALTLLAENSVNSNSTLVQVMA